MDRGWDGPTAIIGDRVDGNVVESPDIDLRHGPGGYTHEDGTPR